jgi:hypothetical protein
MIRRNLMERAQDFGIILDDVSITHLSFGTRPYPLGDTHAHTHARTHTLKCRRSFMHAHTHTRTRTHAPLRRVNCAFCRRPLTWRPWR